MDSIQLFKGVFWNGCSSQLQSKKRVFSKRKIWSIHAEEIPPDLTAWFLLQWKQRCHIQSWHLAFVCKVNGSINIHFASWSSRGRSLSPWPYPVLCFDLNMEDASIEAVWDNHDIEASEKWRLNVFLSLGVGFEFIRTIWVSCQIPLNLIFWKN